MAVLSSRRIPVLIGVLVAGIALLAPIPASAQTSSTEATPLVGGTVVATCPPGTVDVDAGTDTVGGVTVGFPSGGRCTDDLADAEGSYTLAGSDPQSFTSECVIVGDDVVTRSAVYVPEGTTVNGTVVDGPTVVTEPNAEVIYPDGTTATLNQTVDTGTSVIQNAIVFDDGTIVGQAECFPVAAAYPLAVDTAAPSSGAPVGGLPVSSGGDGGPSTGLLMVGGLIALALMAQVAVGRRMRHSGSQATG